MLFRGPDIIVTRANDGPQALSLTFNVFEAQSLENRPHGSLWSHAVAMFSMLQFGGAQTVISSKAAARFMIWPVEMNVCGWAIFWACFMWVCQFYGSRREYSLNLHVMLLIWSLNCTFLAGTNTVAVEEPAMISSCGGRVRSDDHWWTLRKGLAGASASDFFFFCQAFQNKLLQVVAIMTRLVARCNFQSSWLRDLVLKEHIVNRYMSSSGSGFIHFHCQQAEDRNEASSVKLAVKFLVVS